MKVIRVLLGIVLTPIILVWNVMTVGIAVIIGFVAGVLGSSARTIDRVIFGRQQVEMRESNEEEL